MLKNEFKNCKSMLNNVVDVLRLSYTKSVLNEILRETCFCSLAFFRDRSSASVEVILSQFIWNEEELRGCDGKL